jgi:hypothetical protein
MKKYLFLSCSVLFVIFFTCSCGYNENVERISSFPEPTVPVVTPEKNSASSDSDVTDLLTDSEILTSSEVPSFTAHHTPEPGIPEPVHDVIAGERHDDDSEIFIVEGVTRPDLWMQPSRRVMTRVADMYQAAADAVERILTIEQMSSMSVPALFDYARNHLVEIINAAGLNGYSKNYFYLAYQFAMRRRNNFMDGDTATIVLKVFDIKAS